MGTRPTEATRLSRRSSERPSAPQWTFRSDSGRLVQLDLDLQDYTDPENDPLIPHTEWSPFDGREKRAPADDLSPSDPAR